MFQRRIFLTIPTALAIGRPVLAASFDTFLDGVRAEARRAGISASTVQQAFAGIRPNDRVLELDRKQPEGAMSWEQYRDRIVSPTRIENGRRNFNESRPLLDAIRHPLPGRPAGDRGDLGDGDEFRHQYRRLRGDRGAGDAGLGRPPRQLLPRGVYRRAAGAGGRPRDPGADARQLGRRHGPARDSSPPISNGWRWISTATAGATSGTAGPTPCLDRPLPRAQRLAGGGALGPAVQPPAGLDVERIDTDAKRPLREWGRAGFRRADGGLLPASELEASLVLPRNGTTQVFLAHRHFPAICRYNPPVNYALAVGLLADQVG